MKLFTISRQDLTSNEWNDFVSRSNTAWFLHLWDFINIHSTWRGHTDKSFGVVDERKRILCLVPLQFIKQKTLRGLFDVNILDFHGGFAVRNNLNKDDLENVVKFAQEYINNLAYKESVAEINLKILPPASGLTFMFNDELPKMYFSKLGYTDTSGYTRMINLSDSLDQIRKNYNETTRWMLRKTLKIPYKIREAENNSRDLDAYYKLHVETYSRTGVIPHSFDYFKGIFEELIPKKLSRIVFLECNGEIVAAHNAAFYKDKGLYWTNASKSEKSGDENRLLMDNQIEYAKKAGFSFFEIGEVSPNATDKKMVGLTRFKSSFGGDNYKFYKGHMTLNPVYKTARSIKSYVKKIIS